MHTAWQCFQSCLSVHRLLKALIYSVPKKFPPLNSLQLSNLNRFSDFLHCCKAYEICCKTHSTLHLSRLLNIKSSGLGFNISNMPKVKWFMSKGFIANFVRVPAMQNFWKLVKIWQLQRAERWELFWDTVYKVNFSYTGTSSEYLEDVEDMLCAHVCNTYGMFLLFLFDFSKFCARKASLWAKAV